MAYIGFDLDETLGRFMAIDGNMFFLIPDEVYKTQLKGKEPFEPSAELHQKLDSAVELFAKCLATKEPGLKMLRPGIIDILRKLSDLKSEGRVKAILVYSNNGNLGCLKVATKMIEEMLGKPGLFCNLVHWWHPLRNASNQKTRPGSALKTMVALRKSFQDSRCGGGGAIPAKDIYFFDDLVHPIIHTEIGPGNYFHVKPYKYDADYSETLQCLMQALEGSGLSTDDEYLKYIGPLLAAFGLQNTYENIQVAMERYNAGYPPVRMPFVDDTASILARLDALFSPTNYSENYFPVVDGGRRRMSRRRRVIKSRKQKRKVRKATRKN